MRILKIIFILNVLLAFLFSKDLKQNGDVIKNIIPPQSIIQSANKNLKDVQWEKYLLREHLKLKEEIIAFQYGYLFSQWTLSVLLNEKKQAEKISKNLFVISQEYDIEDDSILLELEAVFKAIKKDFEKNSSKNQRKIKKNIEKIKEILNSYFVRQDDVFFLQKVLFGSWIEFLHLGIQGIKEQYRDKKDTQILNRAYEVDYFVDTLAKELDKNSLVFLKKIKPILTKAGKNGLTKIEIEQLNNYFLAYKKLQYH